MTYDKLDVTEVLVRALRDAQVAADAARDVADYNLDRVIDEKARADRLADELADAQAEVGALRARVWPEGEGADANG